MADGTNARFDFTVHLPSLADLGRVHFVAIGGSGMSAVARLLLARGIVVSGSDAKDSETLRALAAEGAVVHVGHDPAFVEGADTVVISSAIPESNPEVARARALGLLVLHRSQALAVAAQGSRRVAVAGANGKTTTTSMIAVALLAAGADPSFASGSELPGYDSNARLGTGEAFVIEADESDGSFLVYRPEVAVVTNVQPDHLDFYGTFERVQAAYDAFVASRADGGLLVACQDDAGSAALADRDRSAGRRVLTYGFAPEADVVLSDACDAVRDERGFSATATITGPDGVPRILRVAMPGRHNLQNAAGAYAAAVLGLGVDPEAVIRGLADFEGARRRFEVVGTAGGVTVVDDYAHNAGKVTALVGTAVDLVGADHVRVVFQPHLFSRTRDFADGFGAGLAAADDVVLLPIYGAREEPMPGVTSELVADAVRRHNPKAQVEVEGDRTRLVADLLARARPGDLVLIVGAGDVTSLAPQVLAGLGARP
jgi:UDP-N-acetylmuramate--alanine ligase